MLINLPINFEKVRLFNFYTDILDKNGKLDYSSFCYNKIITKNNVPVFLKLYELLLIIKIDFCEWGGAYISNLKCTFARYS